MYNPDILHNPPAGFAVREASYDDVEDLTRLWYSSFNLSHPFWNFVTPDNSVTRKWLDDTWIMGIRAGPNIFRTFVIEDLSQNKKVVAFQRWHVPQADGNQNVSLPNYPSEWDPELTDALWNGMAKARAEVMGGRTHWMGEFTAVDRAYQKKGLAMTFVDWVCRQADAAGLEVYGDVTPKFYPHLEKFGFQDRMVITMPPRPECYGTYELKVIVRTPTAQPSE
ncbi:hypothetical protein TWF506_006192 [Arthrobotrys conoides]|uniref:N-acetyltransferase domain-containing protein n=1 Tax=Arthrobotrys conoides TaxID=74498 RepID=A0AAN8PKC6_9PEZI